MMLDVLVVEDEEIEREALIRLVERRYSDDLRVCGFAESGEAAVARAQTLRPDVILLDIEIPGFDGLEVARRVKRAGVDAEVVIVTAYSRFEYAKEALKLEAVDYIVKPYSIRTLDQTMTRVIGRAAARIGREKPDQNAGTPTSTQIDNPIDRAKAYIESRYIRQITLDEVARAAGMSKYHLSRTFREVVGVGVKEFTIRCRIEHARRLMRQGRSVAEAAYDAGFTDPNYFSRAVRKHTGMTPTELRESN